MISLEFIKFLEKRSFLLLLWEKYYFLLERLRLKEGLVFLKVKLTTLSSISQ